MSRRYICRSQGMEYFENPKVACTSIKAALLETDGVDVPARRFQVHWVKHWDWDTEGDLFRFTFVRHPLDRLVSCYFQKIVTGASWDIGATLPPTTEFATFVRWAFSRHDANVHYAPQTHVLDGLDFEFIGRFENIEDDWRGLQQQFPGLADLPHLNRSKRPHWRECFDAELLNLSFRYYADDFSFWPDYADELGVTCA